MTRPAFVSTSPPRYTACAPEEATRRASSSSRRARVPRRTPDDVEPDPARGRLERRRLQGAVSGFSVVHDEHALGAGVSGEQRERCALRSSVGYTRRKLRVPVR